MQHRSRAATLVAVALLASTAVPARADESTATGDASQVDYFAARPDSQSVTVRRSRSRTRGQQLQLGGAVLIAAAAAGVGVYFHLDSRDAADAVSGKGELGGEAWTADRQQTYDRASRSGWYAGLGYGVSALCFAGVAYLAWKTHPGEETLVLKPVQRTATPVVAPIPGGAMVGGRWRF